MCAITKQECLWFISLSRAWNDFWLWFFLLYMKVYRKRIEFILMFKLTTKAGFQWCINTLKWMWNKTTFSMKCISIFLRVKRVFVMCDIIAIFFHILKCENVRNIKRFSNIVSRKPKRSPNSKHSDYAKL